ncbi:hypothetical protein BLS_006355 [Venturia inaequalis]|uniref:Uncharacterized protein n=1 Tax=Venturia inaequalis TaxID=5025 RepID=A0A8H3UDG3_VENIN|nr:hypothetical protein BLS_006355 [Venturia inaequalis]
MATLAAKFPEETKDLIKNPEKLAFLPESMRDVIPTLSRFQVKQLRGLFDSTFDFLSLPLELRETIYEFHLGGTGTLTTIVRQKQLTKSSAASGSNAALSSSSSGTNEAMTLPSSLSKTCRQIRQEIHNVLYRKYMAKLHVCAYKKSTTKTPITPKKAIGPAGGSVMRGLIFGDSQKATGVSEEGVKSSDRGYRLKRCDIDAFLGFRKVHVVIQSHIPLHSFEYGEKQKGSLGRMLAEWVGMLVAEGCTKATSLLKKEVYLEFKLDGCVGFQSSALWPYSEPGHERFWFYVQVGHAFKKMKEELEGRLPANCPIVLSSSVGELMGLATMRLDAERIRFGENSTTLGRILRLNRGKIVNELT